MKNLKKLDKYWEITIKTTELLGLVWMIALLFSCVSTVQFVNSKNECSIESMEPEKDNDLEKTLEGYKSLVLDEPTVKYMAVDSSSINDKNRRKLTEEKELILSSAIPSLDEDYLIEPDYSYMSNNDSYTGKISNVILPIPILRKSTVGKTETKDKTISNETQSVSKEKENKNIKMDNNTNKTYMNDRITSILKLIVSRVDEGEIERIADYMKDLENSNIELLNSDHVYIRTIINKLGRKGYYKLALGFLKWYDGKSESESYKDWIAFMLGQIYENSKKYRNYDKSVSYYEKIVDLYPWSEYYDISLERLQFLRRHFLYVR